MTMKDMSRSKLYRLLLKAAACLMAALGLGAPHAALRFRYPPLPVAGGSINDSYEFLAEDADFNAGATGGSAIIGSELSVAVTAAGAGLLTGVVYEASLRVKGTVTGTTPTLQVKIQGKDEDGSFFDLGIFPLLSATATDPFPHVNVKNGQRDVKCYFKVPARTLESLTAPKKVVAVRALGTTTGSDTPTFNDVDILLRPAMLDGSIS